MEGTVKFFNESKGYGFITNDDTGRDIFVHVTGLNGETLNEGDKVEYVEEEGEERKVLKAEPPVQCAFSEQHHDDEREQVIE